MCEYFKKLRRIIATLAALFALTSDGAALAAEGSKIFKPENMQFKVEKSRANVITGGQTIDRDPLGNAKDFLVTLTRDREPYCTGVVLTSDLVLTAGHCLEGMDVRSIKVRVISRAAPLKFEELDIEDWRVHPGFSFFAAKNVSKEQPTDRDVAGLADLALIHLHDPSAHAIPAVIVPDDLQPEDLKDPSLFSFGYDRDPKKKYAFSGLITFTELKKPALLWGRRDMYVSGTRNGTMVCQGDSGGPVTISAEDDKIPGRQIHYLLGIHSLISAGIDYQNSSGSSKRNYLPCGEEVYYVNVVNFLDWIFAAAESMAPGSARHIQRFGRN